MASTRSLPAVLTAFLLALATAKISLVNGLEVTTNKGVVRGSTVEVNGTMVRKFVGIPYAEKPVRFSPAVAINASWNGSFDATYYRPSCPQKAGRLSDFVPPFMLKNSSQMLETSEDCLNLNVYTPSPSSGNATDKWAVLVWFHGGSYMYGTGSAFEATALAAKGGIVVVTVNYRLGPFGFLQTDDGMAPGNLGLRDQQLALKWVMHNIGAFGGDPEKVTIAGQAGVHGSASLHMFAKESRGLFKRVVTHSGVFKLEDLQEPEKAVYTSKLLAELAGCPPTPSESLLMCLREKDTDDILSYNHRLFMMKNSTFVWQPVRDSDFFSMDADGHKYDLLAPFNTGDGTIAVKRLKMTMMLLNGGMMPTDGAMDGFKRWVDAYVSTSPVVQKAVKYQYMDRDIKNETVARVAALVDAQTGWAFSRYGSPAISDLESMLESARLMAFDHRSSADNRFPEKIPAPHGSEIPYVFGLPFVLMDKFTEEERILSHRMMMYWSNFAKTGNPNGMNGMSGNATTMEPTWPEYKEDSMEYLKVKADGSEAEDEYKSADIYFWSEYLPELKEVVDEACPDPMRPSSSKSPGTTYSTVKPYTTMKDCPDPVLGKGMGLRMNVRQAESLIQALLVLCLVMCCIAVLAFVVCFSYKPRPKQVSLDDVESEEPAKPAGMNGAVHGGETSSAGTSGSPSHGDHKDKTIFLEDEEAPVYAKSMKMKAAAEDDTEPPPPEEAENHTHVYANVAYSHDPEDVDEPNPPDQEEQEELDIDEIFPPPPGEVTDEVAADEAEMDEIPPPYDEEEDEPEDDPQDADSETEINTKL